MRNIQFFSVFSLLVWSPNARKRLDATFGSRRGAILQQNPTMAHLPGLKVLFSSRHGARSIVLTHSVGLRAAMRNIQFFSVFSLLVWSRNARKRLYATFGSRRGAILRHICESAHHRLDFHFFGIVPTNVVTAQCPLLTQSSPNLPIQSNGIFPIVLLSPPARKPLDACSGEPFYSQIGHRHTITQISFDFSACFQSTLRHRNATGLPKSASTRQFNRIAFSESRFCLQLPENRSMQLVACPGEPFFS